MINNHLGEVRTIYAGDGLQNDMVVLNLLVVILLVMILIDGIDFDK